MALFGEANAEAESWLSRYRVRTQSEDLSGLTLINPKYVLRNHLGELAIRAAKSKDFSVLHQLQTVLADPFAEHPAFDDWAGFAPDWAAGIEISCSS